MRKKTEQKSTTKRSVKSTAKKAAPVKKATVPAEKAEPVKEAAVPAEKAEPVKEAAVPAEKAEPVKEAAVPAEKAVPVKQAAVVTEAPVVQPDLGPRRSVAFIGSECYPFVKTGGLGDVMYALPKALAKLNLDVKVILPRYKCIPQKFQEKMEYRGSFYMNLCSDGKQYYVGIMEYQEDGVVYDFIDNDRVLFLGKSLY